MTYQTLLHIHAELAAERARLHSESAQLRAELQKREADTEVKQAAHRHELERLRLEVGKLQRQRLPWNDSMQFHRFF